MNNQFEAFLWGLLAVTVCGVTSVLGVPLVAFNRRSFALLLVLQFFIAMAVSSMASDALMHLWALAIGVHVAHLGEEEHEHEHVNETAGEHEEGEHEEEHDHSAYQAYLWRCLMLLGTLYAFYLFEWLMHMRMDHRRRQTACTDEHHDCQMDEDYAEDEAGKRPKNTTFKERAKEILKRMYTPDSPTRETGDKNTLDNIEETRGPQPEKRVLGIPESKLALVSLITFGDMFHNTLDGVAIGAAFAYDFNTGLSTAIAVFVHELPHELGDIAIYYDCGLSMCRVLVLNVCSGLSAYVGLAIGAAVATTEGYEWIFAVTAGMFLYVAFIDLMPQLVHVKSRRPVLVFLVQNVGLWVGTGLMLLLALLE